MSASQRRKGHDWEREVANLFRDAGFAARRGLQQPRDGSEVPDVEVEGFWIECKRGRRTSPQAALRQAIAAVPDGRIPVAVCKDDRAEPTVTLLLKDFLTLPLDGPAWAERRDPTPG